MEAVRSVAPPPLLHKPGPRSLRPAPDPLRAEVFRRWIVGGVLVAVAGGGIVFAFLAFAAPILLTPGQTHRLLLRCSAVMLIVIAVGAPALLRLRRRRFATSTAWLREYRPPTNRERQQILAAPAKPSGCRVRCGPAAQRFSRCWALWNRLPWAATSSAPWCWAV